MNDANNAQDAASVDSILNFETVKYHAAEDFETNRYADAVDKLLVCEVFSAIKLFSQLVCQSWIRFGFSIRFDA